MEKERFTMLLLEPGEIFFEDYSAQMRFLESSDSKNNEWIEGRLKVCSKSLVFVNKDITQPLIKIQLKETILAEIINSSNTISGSNNLSIECKSFVKMLEGNVLAPYKFIHQKTCFQFNFNYANVEDCLAQILQLLRAASLPTAEQNSMIMAIVHSRQSRVSFDTSWLEDLYEEVVIEVQANKVLPLVVNPGRVLLTNSRIYFQPYNNMDQHPVLKIQLKDIKNVIKRRFLLRQVGLEIKWTKVADGKPEYLFLSLSNQEDRDNLYSNLLKQSQLSLETIPQNQMTMQWQNGIISNYDYLLYINSLADRTFHDLTQYPVMPWIINDYTSDTLDLDDPNIYRDLSKPIGALEPQRLERLKERYEEMSEPKFLYGSHYSAPGFVLFYLVRKYPQYMLCLQNGRFDHADRMFNCVSDVWRNVMVNMSDFKEVIPAFYDVSNKGDFLVNGYGIDFGYRHDGTKVGDVLLPPWAEGPSDFVNKLRNALESNWVSENLHNWIDLIFGYKQRGEEAEKANNVFFHLCYEGAVDLDTIRDANDRHGIEVQIMEFGQVPKQVFTLPHPRRQISCDFVRSETILTETKCKSNEKENSEILLKESMNFQSHKEGVNCVSVLKEGGHLNDIVSVGCDGNLKFYSISSQKLTRSVTVSLLPLSSCISYQISTQCSVIVIGSWDNNLVFYDVEFGKVIDTLLGHEDAVSCLAYSSKNNVIISGSWDCTVKIWRSYTSGTKIRVAECLVAQLDHECKVNCINLSRDETLLVSGTEDGEIFLWDMETYNLQFNVKGHSGKVNALTFEPESNNIISCGVDKVLSVLDFRTGTQICSKILEVEALSLTWLNSLLLIGDGWGDVSFWDPKFNWISKFNCHNGPVTSIVVTIDNKKVITGGKDRKIIVWDID